jgi:hypothetical protein
VKLLGGQYNFELKDENRSDQNSSQLIKDAIEIINQDQSINEASRTV